MNVRRATEQDTPAIVELLKQSLGESLMPKSTDYWYWKHVNNPYGASPTLLSEDAGKIVGVRAFMRWQWQQYGRKFEAVRAVDTATHPDYQGKGIFRKLTLSLVEECQAKGWNFVFNTPNEKSKPGYIKMGWEEAGKLPVNFRVVNPFGMAFTALKGKSTPTAETRDESVAHYLSHAGMPALIEHTDTLLKDRVHTVHSVDSLRWRYLNVPGQQYFAAGEGESGRLKSVFFYRIKTSRLGREFRITDLFLDSPEAVKSIRGVLRQELRKRKADYVTLGSFSIGNILGAGLSWKQAPLGPIVTVRSLAMADDEMNLLREFKHWSPSVGDLELF